jgi:hypothetical protein
MNKPLNITTSYRGHSIRRTHTLMGVQWIADEKKSYKSRAEAKRFIDEIEKEKFEIEKLLETLINRQPEAR